MSIKYGSNRFFPRGDSGGGGGGPDLWTLYGGTIVGLTTITDTVAIGDTAMLSTEKLLVIGGIAADDPTGLASYLQTGAGSAAPVSDAGAIRFRYNEIAMQAELSTNGGAYVPLASGGASPWVAAAGVITEVVPANLVVVGSAAALNAEQFQVLGDSTLRAAVDSTSTFAVEDAATNPIFQVDTVNNASVVRGSYQMSSGITADVYLESGPSTAANAGAGAGRIRYNNAGTPSWQGSVNGGAFSDFITAATLPTVAFVQNGNSFGADAVLGTNDAFALQFETGGTTRGRFTSAGLLLVNTAAAVSTEQVAVAGGIASNPTGAGNDAFLAFGSGSGVAVSTANAGRFRYNAGVAQVSLNTGAYSDLITAATLPTVAFVQNGNSFGADAVLGTNDAFALQFETSGTTRGRFTSAGLLLVNTAAAVSTEQVAVAGGIASNPTGAGNDAFLAFGSGSGVAVSTANAGRFRYNAGVAQVSLNTGAYSDLITAATLPTVAFVQNGNTFGADAVLGTNDAFALQFETSGTTRGRFTSAGLLLVNTAAAVSTEQVAVAGGIASNPTGAGNDAFLAFGSGSGVAVSTANAGRFRYNAGVAQVSLNTGAYSDLITAATLPTVAFVQNGNSFGADAVLGTNDAFALQFETSGTSRGRFTSTGAFVIDSASASVTTLPASTVVTDLATGSTATMQIAGGTSQVRVDDVPGQNVILRPGSIEVFNSVQLLTIQPANITASSNVTISAPGGLAQVDGIFAVIQSTLGPVVISSAAGIEFTTANEITVNGAPGAAGEVLTSQGAGLPPIWAAAGSGSAFVQNGNSFGADAVLGTNDAFALQFETNGVTRGRFTSTGVFLVAAAAASGTESVRVTGGGILNDGTQSITSVTSTLSLNNSGGAINIGDNADAQAINIGTGAAARTITLGNSTGATSLVLDAGTGPISIGTSNFARTTSIATGAAVQSVTIGSTTANSVITLQANTGAITMQTLAGTDFINIGTSANARTVSIATGAAAQSVTIGSSTGASSLTLNAGTGPISIGASASARTTSIATGAAAQTINIGTTNTTSSIANSFGTSGFGLIQGAATSGTPIGVLMTAGAHTGLAIAEVTDVNFNLARTVTFGAGGGTLATQRAYRVQGPTYAAAAALTITDLSTMAVSQPVVGANVAVTAGATGPTMPTDTGVSGGAYTMAQTPALRVDGSAANGVVTVAVIVRNTASSANALQTIGWQSNSGALDGAMGFQTGSSFDRQRFALLLRNNGTLLPSLTISSQGSYRFLNGPPSTSATTPAGFLFTGTANGAVNTYAASVEANQFSIAANQTYTFATGAITTQRSVYIQAPTYAFSAASTITDTATVAINSAPVLGGNATFTRSMALWVQGGAARFDSGVSVKVIPGGTGLQGLGADFRKSNDPGSTSYPNGVSVIPSGSYTPATGYLSIIPAFWTLPQAIASGGGVGPPLNPGIRFNWSDGTTTIRYNLNTAAALTETRDTVDFNKDGYTIVSVDFIVDNTTGGASTQDFGAWTLDGNQF